jgi:hypothetical protein
MFQEKIDIEAQQEFYRICGKYKEPLVKLLRDMATEMHTSLYASELHACLIAALQGEVIRFEPVKESELVKNIKNKIETNILEKLNKKE